jgi:hypothetical protein
MKQTRYTGTFLTAGFGESYKLEVSCDGFLQAFFLLTAKAIQSGRHYQLNTITDEHGTERVVDDITKVNKLILY